MSAFIQLKEEYDAKARELLSEIERVFPVGTPVDYVYRNKRRRGIVQSHGCWWYQPDGLHVTNSATGKTVHLSSAVFHNVKCATS